MDEDIKYLFDALWYGYCYGSSIDHRQKLHELAVKYNYEPIVDALKQAGVYEEYRKDIFGE